MSTVPETENEVSLGVRLISVLLTPKRYMDTKILTHPTSCLSAKFNFSMKIDKLLFRFSMCSIKAFLRSSPSLKFSVLGHLKSVHIPLESTDRDIA